MRFADTVADAVLSSAKSRNLKVLLFCAVAVTVADVAVSVAAAADAAVVVLGGTVACLCAEL